MSGPNIRVANRF